MADENDNTRKVLLAGLARLSPYVTGGRIVGSGPSQFLIAERDARGVEIYGNDEAGFTIDPSIKGELQGEITFPSVEAALAAAIRWLEGGGLEELRKGAK